MATTSSGITEVLQPTTSVLVAVSMTALQLPRESNTLLLGSTVSTVRPSAPLIAASLIYPTLAGMLNDFRLSHSSKAWARMLSTDSGITTFSREAHPLNAYLPID